MFIWCIQSYGSSNNQKGRVLINPIIPVIATIAQMPTLVTIFKGDYLQNEDRIKVILNKYYKYSDTPDMYK